MNNKIHFSVIMPTFNQCAFIRRAIKSLMQQTYDNWELIIINDGCTDETEDFIHDFMGNNRISYINSNKNMGLGHALNQGISAAKYEHIAYLPSDDFYFPEHLESLATHLEKENAILAFSGLQYATDDTMNRNISTRTKQIRNGHCLQLVQTAHRKLKNIQWTERKDFLTEDLYLMFWNKLAENGHFIPTNTVSCFWTSHPQQRHRLLSEKYGGGLNKYRNHYKTNEPLKIKVSRNKFIDEEILYKDFHNVVPTIDNAMKILLVGELAYNPERIYALEQAGHVLFGLWDPYPMYSFTTVGPLSFGNITNIPHDDWKSEIARIKPDIIYGLLNSSPVAFVYEVVKTFPEIPYVWHFKEGPSVVLNMGNWEKLIYLYNHAAGRIYLNEATRQWYNLFLPPSNTPSILLDGDLPKEEYFKNHFSPKLSDTIGGIHTVVTGRMIGISDEDIKKFAKNDIHIHLYTENYYEGNNRESLKKLAPSHFHIHQHVMANKWTEEFSKYDAGWLHGHRSCNKGNLLMATWDDLNLPARISTYAAAGLPIILPDNTGNTVGANEVIKKHGIGIEYRDTDEIIQFLQEEKENRKYAQNMMKCRMMFCFDYHVPRLMNFFQLAISHKQNNDGK